jgi:cell division protein FtsB
MLKRQWPFLLLLVLLVGLQAVFWFGNGGWPAMLGLREQVDKQRSENASLKQRNDALKAEVEDLKSGEAAVEERARNELGMIKPGETFYRVVDPKKKSADAEQDEAKPE